VAELADAPDLGLQKTAFHGISKHFKSESIYRGNLEKEQKNTAQRARAENTQN
jgi:hypothetical protein